MDKPIFYCDCDGVILNTIEVGFNIMREMGCNMTKRDEVDYYFKHVVDWNEIFKKASFINNSVNQINYLKKQDVFEDIIILTKLCGAKDEERLKKELFNDVLYGTKVITLEYGLSKSMVVPAKDNILLDDEIRNCREWREKDGVAILFSLYASSFDNNVVSNISDVVNTDGVKKLIKTRYF